MDLDLSDVILEDPKPDYIENPTTFYFQSRQLELKPENSPDNQTKKDGWILGVLLPSIQNITGIIPFVRMPWITGQAGVLGALLILILCKCTTLLTALSLSAIVTNGKIQSGGSYYILARSLGPSFGGSVGILFYFGLVSASAMYVLGGVETFIDTADFEIVSKSFDIRLLSIVLLLFLWVVNMLLMKSIAKLTIGLLGIVTICLVCIFIGIVSAESRSEDLPSEINGLSVENLEENKYSEYDEGIGFHTLIAVFYPAVTGFMVGTNRSGFLQNPQNAIPKGTILAIFIMFLMYGSFIVFFGGVCKREALDDLAFAATVAWPTPILVGIGVIVSSIGCALIALNSAPQILSSIANDNILPLKYFVETQEALKISTLIASLIVLVGSLDAVAPIITMFFLLFYGFINVASCLLSLLDNPSWRPQWPFFHWSTAMVGSLLCFGIMIYITWWAACLSFILAGILYYYIDMRTQATNWGDGITGLRQERAKKALLGVHPEKVLHVKNWKPQLLVLDFTTEENTPKHPGLISMVEQLKKGNGLTIFGTCKVGEENKHNFKKVKETTTGLYEYFRSKRIEVFTKVVLAKTAKRGMKILIEASGLGGLEPNSVMMAWPEYWEGEPLRAARFCKLADFAEKTGLAFLALKPAEAFEDGEKKISSIDIWWFCYDGGLMCLLAYLLKKHRNWRDCLVRIFYVVLESEGTERHTLDSLKEWISNYRMFSNVHTELVTVPPEALMEHHSRLKEKTKIKEKQLINKFSPMKILDEIEQTQLDLANEFMEKGRLSLGEEMSVYGYRRENSGVEDDGVLINRKISEFSRYADLVITALPDKPPEEDAEEYLRFCESLTRGLPRVLLVKGTDNSVVTDLTELIEIDK